MDFSDFDPGWTREEAKNAGDDGPRSPFQRWQAWVLMLEMYRMSFEEGERESALEALRLCALHGLPMPDWLSDGYQQCYREWRHLHVKTLDEAFGTKRPKGANFASIKKARMLEINVPLWAMILRRKGAVTDESLFQEIGRRLNVSTSTARSAYYRSWYYRKLLKKR